MSKDVDINNTSLFLALSMLKNMQNSSTAFSSLLNGVSSINLGNCALSSGSMLDFGKSRLSSILGGTGSGSVSGYISELEKLKEKLSSNDESTASFFKSLEDNGLVDEFASDLARIGEVSDVDTRIEMFSDLVSYYEQSVSYLASGYTRIIDKDKNGDILGVTYLPPNYVADGTSPLLVYLIGDDSKGTFLGKDGTFDYGLGYLMDNGYDPNAVVYIPRSTTGNWETCTSIVCDNIMDVANKYNVDQDKKSIIGFSMGGAAIPFFLKEMPDEFAAAAIVGVDVQHYDWITESSAMVTIFNVCGNRSNTMFGYNKNIDNMDNVQIYNVSGCTHMEFADAILSEDFLKDFINIDRNGHYETTVEPINVDNDLFKNNSIRNCMETGYEPTDSWYSSLTGNEGVLRPSYVSDAGLKSNEDSLISDDVDILSDSDIGGVANISSSLGENVIDDVSVNNEDVINGNFDSSVDESGNVNVENTGAFEKKVHLYRNTDSKGTKISPDSILIDNKPETLFGKINFNSVSQNNSRYEIPGINKEIYQKYLVSLKEKGFYIDSMGNWTNGDILVDIDVSPDFSNMVLNMIKVTK